MFSRAVAGVVLLSSSLASANSLALSLSPINGTNDLLRNEVPFGFVEVENLTTGSLGAAGATFALEVRPVGSDWQRCPGLQIDIPDAPRPPFGSELQPRERRNIYLGSLDVFCPELGKKSGRVEIRPVFESKETGLVMGVPQAILVREPEGLDLAALEFREQQGQRLSRDQFVAKFPGSRYVAPYILNGRPDRPLRPLAQVAKELRGSPSASQLGVRQERLGAFLERNPGHLFAEPLLREYVAIASARGDKAALESGIRAIEARHPGSKEAAEARELLQHPQ